MHRIQFVFVSLADYERSWLEFVWITRDLPKGCGEGSLQPLKDRGVEPLSHRRSFGHILSQLWRLEV